MARPSFIANFLLRGSFAFSATVSAQTSSIEGNVVDTDGRPLKNAEIRFDQKGKIPAIATRTDVNGHYTAALPMGFYKMSVIERGAVKSALTVKATGKNSRIDFDLRPSAEKQIRHYVGSARALEAICRADGLKPALERLDRPRIKRLLK